MDSFSPYQAPSNLQENPSQYVPGFGNYRQETHAAGIQARTIPAGSTPQLHFQLGPAYGILRPDRHTVRPQPSTQHGPGFGTYGQDTHTARPRATAAQYDPGFGIYGQDTNTARRQATTQHGPGFGTYGQDTHTVRPQAAAHYGPGFGTYGQDTHTATLQARVQQLEWILQSKAKELKAVNAERLMWKEQARGWEKKARVMGQFINHHRRQSTSAAQPSQVATNLHPIVEGDLTTSPQNPSRPAVPAPTAPVLQADGVTVPSSPISPSADVAPVDVPSSLTSSSLAVVDLTSPPASPITGKRKRSLENEQSDSRAAFYVGLGQKSRD